MRVRRALLLAVVLLLCSGFEWPGRVARLRRELRADDTERRLDAVRLLAHYPAGRVTEAVLMALEDEDAAVRAEAARTAARIRLREAVPVLLDWLDEPEADTRVAAARALQKLGDARALSPLVRLLGDNSAEVRRAALGALAGMESDAALSPLLGRLQDDDPGVRLEAIRAAGRLGDPLAVVPLVRSTRDGEARIRAAALAALGDIGDRRALSALTAGLADSDEGVRISAASALGKLGDEAAMDALSARLPDTDPRTAGAVLAAAGSIAGERARSLLLDNLGHAELGKLAADALVERARRASAEIGEQGQEVGRVIEALVERMQADRGERRAKSVACAALLRLSSFASIRPAAGALLAELERNGDRPAGELLLALGATGSPEVLVPLLERLQPSVAEQGDELLDALLLYFERAPDDGRAADPLLAFLQQAVGERRVKTVTLLGAAGCRRAIPVLLGLLEHKQSRLKLAAIRALGAIGDAAAAPGLLHLLGDRQARVRFEAARALARAGTEKEIGALAKRLLSAGPVDRHAVMHALGGMLPRLRAQQKLSPDASRVALQALSRAAAGEDDRLAARAVDALGAWGEPAAAPVVGVQAASPALGRRVGAIMALGRFDTPEVLGSLRLISRKGPVQVLSAAAISIGEMGTERDVDALVRMAERFRWPVPASVSYSLARLARRGELRKRALGRKLCVLARSREPYVRANLAVAMAAMGAAPCDKGPDPLRWLDIDHAAVVRAGAARWIRAAAAAGRIPEQTARRALGACAERDPEPGVARACRESSLPALDGKVDVHAYEADGETLLRFKLVALRMSDGSVFVGYTDPNGHLRIDNASRGAFELEYPGLTPLEPME